MITRDDSLAIDKIPKHGQRPDHVLKQERSVNQAPKDDGKQKTL